MPSTLIAFCKTYTRLNIFLQRIDFDSAKLTLKRTPLKGIELIQLFFGTERRF